MKYTKYSTVLLTLLLIGACDQEVPEFQDPAVEPGVCDGAAAGSANFTKFVAIGNSYVAGFQAGALFTEGQNNSLPAILSKQFQCVGGAATFNQPSINSVNGYNIQSSIPNVITLGKLVLFDPDGTGPRTPAPYPSGFPGSAATCPAAVNTPALPAPYNTADLPTAFAGDKAALNNFGVPLIFLGQALTPDTGNPTKPVFNPLWARFASQPGVKSILEDALAAQGTFYLVWLGFDDVLLNAATGDDGTYPMTSAAAFGGQYDALIDNLLLNPNLKGVVGNIPNITTIPYFFTVGWNAISLDATRAGLLQASLANGYNQFLAGMLANGIITQAEHDKRRLAYAAGPNGVMLNDEDLTDLTPYMNAAPETQPLLPYARARQATATDLIPLAAGSVLGTCAGGDPTAIYGVSIPVGDKYALTTAEITVILTRTAQFNGAIAAAVAGSDGRLALADVNKAYADFVTARIDMSAGLVLTPNFAPPTAAFSPDGLHPNSRGYAFTANVFIDAINATFGATIPKANIGLYRSTDLPVTP